MYAIINNFYNKPNGDHVKGAWFFTLYFAACLLSFGIDSANFAEHFFDGRIITNILIVGIFFRLLNGADSRLRKLMLVMVPLGLVGEIVFSPILHLYDYRLSHIPVYVPFGHSILFATGYKLHQTQWAQTHNEIMKKVFFVFFICLFLTAGIIFNDILTLIFGFMFFYYGMRLKKWNTLYYYIAFCALFVEFIGVYCGIWLYTDRFLGFIPTISPPVGTVYLYLCGDAVMMRILRLFDRKNILTPLDGTRPNENW